MDLFGSHHSHSFGHLFIRYSPIVVHYVICYRLCYIILGLMLEDLNEYFTFCAFYFFIGYFLCVFYIRIKMYSRSLILREISHPSLFMARKQNNCRIFLCPSKLNRILSALIWSHKVRDVVETWMRGNLNKTYITFKNFKLKLSLGSVW